jgi:hypothetical protein
MRTEQFTEAARHLGRRMARLSKRLVPVTVRPVDQRRLEQLAVASRAALPIPVIGAGAAVLVLRLRRRKAK